MSRGSIVRKERFVLAHGLRIQCIAVGKAWKQACEVADPLSLQSGSRAMNAGAQLVYCLLLSLRS